MNTHNVSIPHRGGEDEPRSSAANERRDFWAALPRIAPPEPETAVWRPSGWALGVLVVAAGIWATLIAVGVLYVLR